MAALALSAGGSPPKPLPTIQMFWHGAPLSRVERLSLVSFVRNGHPVDLYVYDELAGVPDGVRVRDAAQILPRDALFRHPRSQSYAVFADWFRYQLLFERGGIWADVDMVCLKPLDYPNAQVFAWQDAIYLNNAVLGLPAGDPLARWMASASANPNKFLPYDGLGMRFRKLLRFAKGNRRENVRWGESGPKGLTKAARHLGYLDRALPSWHFYPVIYENYRLLFESAPTGTASLFNGASAVHFWNHALEDGQRLDKSGRFPADSPFEQLWLRYLGDDVAGSALRGAISA